MPTFSTLWHCSPEYGRRVRTIARDQHSAVSFLRAIVRVRDEDVLIVNGALGREHHWRDLLACGLARLLGRDFEILVADATWIPRSVREDSSAGRLHRAYAIWSQSLLRALGRRNTSVCFLSRSEVEDFIAQTGWPASRVLFTPFMASIPSTTLAALEADPPRRAPLVFSGGNTLRDHDLLRGALADCGATVRVATRHVDRPWPSNFDVGPCPDDEFHRLTATAAVGVLALRDGRARSSGQQTYLNFLRLGTPVVVNDAPGVRDHLEHVPGAFITPAGDADAIRKRVRWILDPANASEVRELAAAGSAIVAARYSPDGYYSQLADIADDLAHRDRAHA